MAAPSCSYYHQRIIKYCPIAMEEEEHTFNCCEFLLLQRLQENARLRRFLQTRLQAERDWGFHAIVPELCQDDDNDIASDSEGTSRSLEPQVLVEQEAIFRPLDLWFLAKTLEEARDRFVTFLCQEKEKEEEEKLHHTRKDVGILHLQNESLLSRYLSSHNFVELRLDKAFSHLTDLPKELFRCRNVRVLSLTHNSLSRLPAEIGRLEFLEKLHLTGNQLEVRSVPFSLTFCTRLRELHLDHNLLDALPGFLLRLPLLENVRRHGNHNYFQATFVWFHSEVNNRVLPQKGDPGLVLGLTNPWSWKPRLSPPDLQVIAAQTIIGAKTNFFRKGCLPPALQDYVSDIYFRFNVCAWCPRAKLVSLTGFKVVSFRAEWLGNRCVPFVQWACSGRCAEAIERPARKQQLEVCRRMDHDYEEYIHRCQEEFQSREASRSHDSICCLLL